MAWHALDWIIEFWRVLLGAAGAAFLLFFKKKVTVEAVMKFGKNLWGLNKTITGIIKRITILENTNKAAMNVDRHPIFIVNAKRELIYANTAWKDLMGFSNIEDAYGLGYLQAIPEADMERIERLSKRIMEHPSSYVGEIKFQNVQTQVIFTTKCRSEIIKDTDGGVEQILGRLYVID